MLPVDGSAGGRWRRVEVAEIGHRVEVAEIGRRQRDVFAVAAVRTAAATPANRATTRDAGARKAEAASG